MGRKLLVTALNRVLLFFFLLCLLGLFLYGMGNVRGFADSTLSMLLGLVKTLGFLLALGALYALVLDFFYRPKVPAFLWRLIWHGLLGLFGFAASSAALFILTLAEGNAG